MTRADKILIASVLTLALTCYTMVALAGGAFSFSPLAVVSVSGKETETIDLASHSGTTLIEINGKKGKAVLQVKDDRLRMIDSSCPDLFCVKRGWISRPGESIVCVPNEITVNIDAPQPVDAVTW